MTEVSITPSVNTKPNNLVVGQLAVLNCIAVLNTDIGPDMSSLHEKWYHNYEIITTDTVKRGANLQLQLKKVKTSLAGYYECVAWIDDNTLRNKSDNHSIDLSESPYVDVFTTAVFKWSYIRGGSEFSDVLPTSKNGLKMYSSSLSLLNFNLSSAGEYTCDVYLYSNFSFVKNSTNQSDKITIKINGNVTFMYL